MSHVWIRKEVTNEELASFIKKYDLKKKDNKLFIDPFNPRWKNCAKGHPETFNRMDPLVCGRMNPIDVSNKIELSYDKALEWSVLGGKK
jgi:hypothetical protein